MGYLTNDRKLINNNGDLVKQNIPSDFLLFLVNKSNESL